jgi:hypothetical protein
MMFGNKFHRFPSIAGFRDNFEIRLLFQQQTQARPDNSVIVREQDSNLWHRSSVLQKTGPISPTTGRLRSRLGTSITEPRP